MRRATIIDKTDKPVLLRFYKKKVIAAVMPLWWGWGLTCLIPDGGPEYNS